jgi:hypothetical protein
MGSAEEEAVRQIVYALHVALCMLHVTCKPTRTVFAACFFVTAFQPSIASLLLNFTATNVRLLGHTERPDRSRLWLTYGRRSRRSMLLEPKLAYEPASRPCMQDDRKTGTAPDSTARLHLVHHQTVRCDLPGVNAGFGWRPKLGGASGSRLYGKVLFW